MTKQAQQEKFDENDYALAPMDSPTKSEMFGLVDFNPFTHLVAGTKNLFNTNLVPAALMALTFAAIVYVLTIPFNNAVRDLYTSASLSSIVASAGTLLKIIGISSLIYLVFYASLNQATVRLVLTGSRSQREQYVPALLLALRRAPVALASFLSMVGLTILPIILAVGFSALLPMLAPLFVIAAMCVSAIALLNLLYVSYVLADDSTNIRVRDVLRTSSALWKVSRGAIICYYLLLAGVGLVIGTLVSTASLRTGRVLATPYTTYSQAAQGNQALTTRLNRPIGIISPLVGAGLGLIISAGLADIYNQAKKHV